MFHAGTSVSSSFGCGVIVAASSDIRPGGEGAVRFVLWGSCFGVDAASAAGADVPHLAGSSTLELSSLLLAGLAGIPWAGFIS